MVSPAPVASFSGSVAVNEHSAQRGYVGLLLVAVCARKNFLHDVLMNSDATKVRDVSQSDVPHQTLLYITRHKSTFAD